MNHNDLKALVVLQLESFDILSTHGKLERTILQIACKFGRQIIVEELL
jgi:hypothetical protein